MPETLLYQLRPARFIRLVAAAALGTVCLAAPSAIWAQPATETESSPEPSASEPSFMATRTVGDARSGSPRGTFAARSGTSSPEPAPTGLRLLAESSLGLTVGAAGLAISQIPTILLTRAGGGAFAPLLAIPLGAVAYPFATGLGVHAGGLLTNADRLFPNALVGSYAGALAGGLVVVFALQPDGILPIVLGFTLPSTAAGVLFYELGVPFEDPDANAGRTPVWRPTVGLGRSGRPSLGVHVRF